MQKQEILSVQRTKSLLYVSHMSAEGHVGYFVATCQYRRWLCLADHVTLHEVNWSAASHLDKAGDPTVWRTQDLLCLYMICDIA